MDVKVLAHLSSITSTKSWAARARAEDLKASRVRTFIVNYSIEVPT
jgi:hypothetical protein